MGKVLGNIFKGKLLIVLADVYDLLHRIHGKVTKLVTYMNLIYQSPNGRE